MVSAGGIAGDALMEKKITLKTRGMTCVSCEKLIEDVVGELDGVKKVRSSRASESTEIVYNEAKVKPEAIKAAIIELGYKC